MAAMPLARVWSLLSQSLNLQRRCQPQLLEAVPSERCSPAIWRTAQAAAHGRPAHRSSPITPRRQAPLLSHVSSQLCELMVLCPEQNGNAKSDDRAEADPPGKCQDGEPTGL